MRVTFAAVVETIDSLADRGLDGRRRRGHLRPGGGGWTAMIHLATTSRFYARWHVAIIDPAGVARYVSPASLLGEAVRVAEGTVRGQQIT